jgi:hypothetical protein
LDGIWLPLVILLSSYLIFVSLEDNLSRITLLTSVLAFLVNALPTLKYRFIYGSAVDQAAHFDLIRTIALSGQVDLGSVYQSTPGFHVLVALLAGFSAGSLTVWSKLLPAFLGSLVPMGFYMLYRRSTMPFSLAKLVIILSAFSLPLLYRLNGTSFTIPLVVFLVIFLFLRQLADPHSGDRLSYTFLLLLTLLTIIFWHPSTTLVLSATLVGTGLFFFLWPTRKSTFLPRFSTIASLGLICIIIALTYWIYSAEFVWLHFVRNIRFALQTDLTQELIPDRIYQLPLFDRLIVFSFYHARDIVLIGLSSLGILLLAFSRTSNTLERILRTYAALWLSFLAVMAIIFISDFGAQGYRRFLYYPIALSPPLAAYGLWRSHALLRNYGLRFSPSLVVASSLAIIILICSLQLYPYQPRVPNLQLTNPTPANPPALWLHQVNSDYQHLMLDFAFNQLPTDTQLVTDYIGYQQSLMFFDRQTRNRSRRTVNQRPEPSYLLLHWPGVAGAYGEQAEYRSHTTLNNWVEKLNMSKVYDNGGSFILYSPDNAQTPFKLEADK